MMKVLRILTRDYLSAGAVPLLCLALFVNTAVTARAGVIRLEAEMEPVTAAPGSGGISFVPTGEPIPVRVSWTAEEPLPTETELHFTIMDYRGQRLAEQTFHPGPAAASGSLFRMIRIPPEPTARRVSIAVSMNGARAFLRDVWTIVQNPDPVPLGGWYPPEKRPDGSLYWWSRGRSELLFPGAGNGLYRIFWCRGGAPLACMEGGRWTLSLKMENRLLKKMTVDDASFEFWALVPQPVRVGGDVRLELASDRTFVPAECQGGNDIRTLAFGVSGFHLEGSMPLDGFDLERVKGGGRFIRPVASARLPVPQMPSVLWFQGRFQRQCVPDGQTIRLSIGRAVVWEQHVKAGDVCVRVPLKTEWFEGFSGVFDLSLHIEPFYFPSACGDSPDERPHGMIVDELFIAPAGSAADRKQSR